MRLLPSLLLAAALGLSACVTVPPAQVALSESARASISSTEIVAPVRQNEIYVFVPSSQLAAAGGGGLLLALIDAGVDSARTHSAEEAVKPLRNAVVDYSFDDKLRSSLQTSLAGVDWLRVSNARVMKEVLPADLDKAIAGSKDGAVLMTGADYHLSNDGSELTVTLAANLFPNNEALAAHRAGKGNAKIKSDLLNSVYRNAFTFTEKLPTVGERDANIAAWSANNGEPLRAALDRGIASVTQQLAADIRKPPAATVAQAAPGSAG